MKLREYAVALSRPLTIDDLVAHVFSPRKVRPHKNAIAPNTFTGHTYYG